MAVTHTKVSAIADGADTTKVRPQADWNATHTLTLQHSALGVEGSALTCAATLVPVEGSEVFHVSGATGPVTAITPSPAWAAGRRLVLIFDSTPTLTHNGTSLILLGAVNYIARAGDSLEFISEGSGNWREVGRLSYDEAAATPSLRTLGTGATQALPGNTAIPTSGTAPGAMLLGGSSASGTDGTYSRDGHKHAQTFIGCRVYNNAAFSVPNNANTAITFNSERYDTDTMHDTGSNTERITFTTAGYYRVTGHAYFAGSATGQCSLSIKLNTTDFIADSGDGADSANGQPICVTTEWYFNAGDYVTLQAYQNSGGAMNLLYTVNVYEPSFMASKIG